MLIDKDTILCCSFAKKAGSFGCFVHNSAFEYLKINYIYKSFSVDNISEAIKSLKILNIRGAGITMPYKKDVKKLLDVLSPSVIKIGACNTVVNNQGTLFGENTDYLGVKKYLSEIDPPNDIVQIIGTGGMSLAVQAVCNDLSIPYNLFSRKDLGKVLTFERQYIFNATPLIELEASKSNNIVTANVETNTGMHLAILQAECQFNLYTGLEFPMQKIIEKANNKYGTSI